MMMMQYVLVANHIVIYVIVLTHIRVACVLYYTTQRGGGTCIGTRKSAWSIQNSIVIHHEVIAGNDQ